MTTDDDPVMLETDGSASEISFSPDGSKLVAAFAPTPLIDDFFICTGGFVFIDCCVWKRHCQDRKPGEKIGPIAWSPTGKYLAICSGEDINDPSEGRLTVVSSAGGTPQDIMPDYLPNITHFEWISDDQLVFLAEDSCGRAIGQIDRNGTNQRIYSRTYDTPVFLGMSSSDDNAVFAFHGSTEKHPNEVFAYQKGNLKKLTDNNPGLQQKRLGKQEVIAWESRDKQKIEGVLFVSSGPSTGDKISVDNKGTWWAGGECGTRMEHGLF